MTTDPGSDIIHLHKIWQYRISDACCRKGKDKKMKKMITAAAVIAAMGAMGVTASADAYVTISNDKGELVMAQEPVGLTDEDGDGTITINDVLITAHNKSFDGGADAGYASSEGDYGLMLTKLWGVENGGSYGYYVNNASAMSLTDPVNDEDSINAFVYTDTTGWSDTYCWFEGDVQQKDVDVVIEIGTDVTFTLNAASFDENWNPVTLPVEGAEITLNGEKTGAFTDGNGKAVVTVPDIPGKCVVSAVSDKQTLVPPAFVVSVEAALPEDTVTDDDVLTISSGEVDAAADVTAKTSPDTGIADTAAAAGIAVIAAGAFVIAKNRK